MRAASIGAVEHGRGTPLIITSVWPIAYSLAGKEIVFSMRAAPTGDILYTLTGPTDEIVVTNEVIEIDIPATAPDDNAVVFSTIVGAYKRLDFFVSVGEPGVVEYRLQGDMIIHPSHGII